MDLNTYRQNVENAKNKYLEANNQAVATTNRAGGFGDELQKNIQQRSDTYETERNDVNTSRANYYNTADNNLANLFDKFKSDPLYALTALGTERTANEVKYRNSQDLLNQKQGAVADMINSWVRAAGQEADNQNRIAQQLKEVYGLAQSDYDRAYAEEQDRIAQENQRRAAAAQQAYYNQMASQSASSQPQQSGQSSYGNPGDIVEVGGQKFMISQDGSLSGIADSKQNTVIDNMGAWFDNNERAMLGDQRVDKALNAYNNNDYAWYDPRKVYSYWSSLF